MKILFVHPNNDYTGSTKVLYDVICSEYVNDKCVVLTINQSEGFLSSLCNVEVRNIWFPKFNIEVPILIPSILSFLSRCFNFFFLSLKADVIYINTVKPYYAAVLSRLLRKKIIWHIHEIFSHKSISVKVMEFVQRHTDAHFIFVSNYVKEQYSISKKSTFEIKYNKLSFNFLNRIRYTNPIERPLNRVLMPASLTKAKGVCKFVEIARLMPNLEFTLVLSCSEHEKDLFVKSIIPSSNCNIYSRQSDMSKFYENADFLLNLSDPTIWVETFGMTIIEAFAYGIPVIVPNIGGPIEIVDNGVNGFCIDVTNTDEVKDRIYELSSHRDKYIDFSKEASNKSKLFC